MKRRSFILLLAFAMAGRTYAQQPEIRVALKTVPGTGPGSPRLSPAMLYGSYSFNFDSARSFKGIPATLANPVIKELDFQPQQGMYELYQRLNGRMSPETIVNELSKSSTDTLSLSAHPIRHIVFILSGFAANGKRVLITDANNNLDFGDDQPITYDSAALEQQQPNVEELVPDQVVAYQFAYKGKVYDRKIHLRMSPYQTAFRFSNPKEQQHYIVACENEYREGSLKIGGKDYVVTCVTAFHPPYFFDSLNTAVYLREVSQSASSAAYNLGDTLLVESTKYTIAAIDPMGGEIVFKNAGKGASVTGSQPGEDAYPFAGKTIDGQPFALNTLRGRYVLLDFWGSWCNPCISAIPDLVQLDRQYHDILSIVNIAYDEQKNIPRLQQLIKTHHMQWTHLFEDMKDNYGTSIIKRFKVEAYPTQILIDPAGKILLRTSGAGKISQVEALLKAASRP